MITIIPHVDKNLADLLRSLASNAYDRENYEVIRDGRPYSSKSKLVWHLPYNIIVLGSEWDRYLLYYYDRQESDDFVIIPSSNGEEIPLFPTSAGIQNPLPARRVYVHRVNYVKNE